MIIEIPTYSLVTITIAGAGADDVKKRADENNKEVMFQNFAPVTYCISEINNTEIVNVKDIDVLMPMYSLIEYSDNYSKTSGSYANIIDEPTAAIINSESFKYKIKITGKTPADGNVKGVKNQYH